MMADGGHALTLNERDDLIKLYYYIGMEYTNIMHVLAVDHDIIVSLRHLKRILKRMGMGRRNYSDIEEALLFINLQLQGSGQLHGYRWLYQKCIDNGIEIIKEDVRLIISALDPVGCNIRKSRKLKRRAYYAKGPNFIWHIDSYDKIKPFGFCINGAIDGFSRKMIWLEVYNNNSNPRIIGNYYMNAVKTLGGCAMFLRGDFGTENSYVRDFQRFLCRNRQDDGVNMNSYLAGSSDHNQRIEAWWSQLRKECIEFWIVLFKDLRDEGHFDGDYLEKNVLNFCFMSMIQVCVI
jgi:hypothetical protein